MNESITWVAEFAFEPDDLLQRRRLIQNGAGQRERAHSALRGIYTICALSIK